MNRDAVQSIDIDPDVFFNLAMKMMKKGAAGGPSIHTSEDLFLISHRGWSLFYTSVGNCDPGQISCESLSIRRGVPTNSRTGERKYCIADAPPLEQFVRAPNIQEKGQSYLPRCVPKVVKRTEYYSSRSSDFWLSIRFDIEEADWNQRIVRQRPRLDPKYSLYASYLQFHRAL